MVFTTKIVTIKIDSATLCPHRYKHEYVVGDKKDKQRYCDITREPCVCSILEFPSNCPLEDVE